MKAIPRQFLCSIALFSLALLLGAAAVEPAAPEALIRQGNAAYARGDFAAAADLYQKAEERSTEPSLATYNLALAKYRLARLSPDDGGVGLAEAAALFRCCLATDDPRRPQALYGLGNCLLHGPPGGDGKNLREAVACYERCVQEVERGSTLAEEARANLEIARLALAQYQKPADRGDDDPGGEEPPKRPTPPRPEFRPGDGNDPGEASRDPRGVGADPAGAEEKPGPDGGREAGTKPNKPLPGSEKDEPLGASEAEAHLNQAVPRVLRDRRDNRRRNVRPVPEGVRDW
jgi:hypothetical protein